MGKRYELVCDEARLYCAIGYGTALGMETLVDNWEEGNDADDLCDFINRTKGKSLRVLITEYEGAYGLGYSEMREVLEDEKAEGEEGR